MIPKFLLADAVWFQLDPPTRTIVTMALLGLFLVGIGFVLFTMLGARWVRRSARDGVRPTKILKKKNATGWLGLLRNPFRSSTRDTIVADQATDETQIE